MTILYICNIYLYLFVCIGGILMQLGVLETWRCRQRLIYEFDIQSTVHHDAFL